MVNRFAVLLAGLLATVVACNSPSRPADAIPVLGVKVTPQSINLLAVGDTVTIAATVSPLNATDRAIAWESTDPSIASVDTSGRVTARAVGFGVFITAFTHDGHHQSSANVSVNP